MVITHLVINTLKSIVTVWWNSLPSSLFDASHQSDFSWSVHSYLLCVIFLCCMYVIVYSCGLANYIIVVYNVVHMYGLYHSGKEAWPWPISGVKTINQSISQYNRLLQ